MFNRLQTKILALLFIGLTIIISFNYVIINRLLQKEILTSITSQGFSSGENLKSQIERLLIYGLEFDEIVGFDAICKEFLSTDDRIIYAMATDLEGNIRFHSASTPKAVIPYSSSLYEAINKNERVIEMITVDSNNYLCFILPITSPYDQHVGAVLLCYPEQLIYEPVHTISLITLFTSIIMLVIEMVVVTLAIYLWVSKPLKRLYLATREIFLKGTNAVNEVSITSNDEIGRLASSFNTMLSHLRKSTVSKDFLNNIISSITDILIVIDHNLNITMVNTATCHLLGYEENELIGQPISFILSSPDTPLLSPKCFVTLRQSGELKNEEITLRTKDAQEVVMLFCFSTMSFIEPNDYHIVCVARDISAIKKADELVIYQANHDMLTGLANRYALEKEITYLLEHSNGTHAFLYLDLDKFKVVNDVCGHHAGDQLLKNLSSMMKLNLRDTDVMARIGGDEFAVLLKDTSIEKGKEIGELLCKTVKEFHFSWNEQLFTLGVSIGAIELNSHTPSSEWLLSMADQTCYLSKQRGGDSVQIFTSDDEDFSTQHQQVDIMPLITTALAEDGFFLSYQPIMSISNPKGLEWYEVLLRMNDATGKLLYPNLFLMAAQRYNLLPAIDHWVIHHFFSNYHRIIKEHGIQSSHLFNINISGASLNTSDFYEFICSELDTYNIPPHTICFEITETSFISNFANTSTFINKLKARGCLFALDDFGTGLCSFSYLKYLPVDFLKIDGDFVKDILDNPIDYAMVSSINEIAHLMGKQTIAEYVENIDIIKLLQEMGVDSIQGYAIGKPDSLEQAHQCYENYIA